MKFFSILMLATALIAGALPATAQQRTRQITQFGEDDAITLNPARAYIFYRTPGRVTYRFLREVTPAEREAHSARRAEALAEARTRYARNIARWQRLDESCNPRRSNCPGPRPIEPTEETFAFELPEADNFVENAFRPRLMNDGPWSAWLIAVEPGTYALYGAISQIQNGVLGVCFCMGSVRFEARAGEITDMGELQAVAPELMGDERLDAFRLGHFATVVPPGPQLRSPAAFAQLPVVPAQLRAADKMPNYFGISITRIAPIPGVLDYRRDVVIDVPSGRPVEELVAPAPAASTP